MQITMNPNSELNQSAVNVPEVVQVPERLIAEAKRFQEAMMMYTCAIREIKTKLEVLNDELSVRNQRNPIEMIKSRVKKPSSIVEKLQRWGISYDAIDRIINRLEQEKYIDEERFCRAFINDKYRFAKWGKMKIGQALQLKKISSSVYWPYLNEIDEEEYHAVLQKLLVAKRKSVRAESEYELNGKLVRFALSRGFEMKDICRCIEVSEENDYSE